MLTKLSVCLVACSNGKEVQSGFPQVQTVNQCRRHSLDKCRWDFEEKGNELKP